MIMKTKKVLLRKKLLGISVFFHMVLIIIAMTSFIAINNDFPVSIDDQYDYMEINFTNNSTSSGMASTKKYTNVDKVKTPKEVAIDEEKVKIESIEEEKNDVKAENIDKTDIDKAEDKEVAASETEGDGERGEMLSGKALGELDFDGEGIFGRKVIYHAPIKELAEQNGKIAINMGINRAGNVVAVAYNKNNSTITDKDLIVRALKMAVKYKFEEDYTAPFIQYGRFTFIFDIKF